MSSWQTVYKTSFDHQAQIVKDVLETSGINAIIFNKKDSSYKFGQVEVRVNPDHVIKSLKIIGEIDLK